MTADLLLNALMFVKTNLMMVMNHREAQVFWKVRYKISLSVRYKNKHLEEPKEHTSVFLKWLRSHHTTALQPMDENFRPSPFKLSPTPPFLYEIPRHRQVYFKNAFHSEHKHFHFRQTLTERRNNVLRD